MHWSAATPLRLAILDDHSLIRLAMKSRLSSEEDFSVVGLYAGSPQLLEGLRANEVDLLILDYKLNDGELDGLNLIRLLRKQYPKLNILISSSEERLAVVSLTLRAGVNGFLGKSQSVDDLVTAIRTVASGRLYLSDSLSFALGAMQSDNPEFAIADGCSPPEDLLNAPSLSPKEKEVLRCCLDGMSVNQIALKFSRSPKTISGQKQTAYRKLGIVTDAELFKLQNSLLGQA